MAGYKCYNEKFKELEKIIYELEEPDFEIMAEVKLNAYKIFNLKCYY